jgi:TetR/AcrR family transcriptional regulator
MTASSAAGTQRLPTGREARRRQARQLGREQLLDAAEELFSRHGFHDTSLREVARLAEFSVGSVYSFFTNKDDLYRQVFVRRGDEFVDGLRAVVEGDDDPVATLHAMLDFEIGFFRAHPAFGRLYLRSADATLRSADPRGTEITGDRYAASMRLQASVFARGIAAGLLHAADPGALARLFSALVSTFQSLELLVADTESGPSAPMSIEELRVLVDRTFVLPARPPGPDR